MAAFRPKKYSYKMNCFSVPAQVVGETCEKIEEKYGEITKENLLEESRDESSPTHALFEWRDDVAAEKWRRRQAGKVLENLTFVYVNNHGEEKATRAYVNVIAEDKTAGCFRSVEVAMSNADMRAEVLKRAMREIEIFQDKYSNLEELSEIFAAIKKTKKKMNS